MTIGEMTAQTPQPIEGEGQECQVEDARHVGLALILADVACSHLQAGDLEKAELCVAEARRHLAFLTHREPSGENPRSVYALARG